MVEIQENLIRIISRIALQPLYFMQTAKLNTCLL